MSAAKRSGSIFITRPELAARWGVSRSTTYQMQRGGHLPPPVKMAHATPRWPLSEIEAIEQRAAADRVAS